MLICKYGMVWDLRECYQNASIFFTWSSLHMTYLEKWYPQCNSAFKLSLAPYLGKSHPQCISNPNCLFDVTISK